MGKEFACQCRRLGFDPWARKIPWRRKWQPTPVFLLGKFHRQRRQAGYSPWGHTEFRTERLSTHRRWWLSLLWDPSSVEQRLGVLHTLSRQSLAHSRCLEWRTGRLQLKAPGQVFLTPKLQSWPLLHVHPGLNTAQSWIFVEEWILLRGVSGFYNCLG